MYLKNFLPFFCCLFLCSACEHEPKPPSYDKQLLLGHWELSAAWRNNKKTETLTGTYYKFEGSGVMRTNFTADMQEGEVEYEFDGRDIIQKSEPETVYQIDSLTSSTLIFTTTFHEFPFKLALSKKQESEAEPETEL